MTFETKLDKETNEFRVRITRGFGVIVLDESEARWLEKVLFDCLPLEDRPTIKQALQEAMDREIDHGVFNGTNEEGDK